MGFFDRLNRKTEPSATPQPAGVAPDPSGTSVASKLLAARERLDAKDLPAALAIYEQVLAEAGERADVLVTISGDLGATGHIPQIIELVAPRYDATRHGPATGLNLLQAYLAVRDADAAQHVLDILFSLNRPELEDRLHGFSNAIAELLQSGDVSGIPEAPAPGAPPAPREVGLALVTISRPIWAYGLESVPDLLPAKDGKVRRIAFAQLALPGAYTDLEAAMKQPEDELGRMSRALPLWLAETFYFSPLYSAIAALGCVHEADGSRRPAIFSADWTAESLKKLVDTTADGLDYIFTGTLRREGADYVLTLKVWEVKKMKARKEMSTRWTAATADTELRKVNEYLRAFMEWSAYPEGAGLPFGAPSAPTAWLEATGTLLNLFLVEKQLMPRELLPPLAPVFDSLAPHAFSPPASSLAWLSLRSRAAGLGLAPTLAEVLLSSHPHVARARAALGL
jgi:hypothetical protein